MTFRQAAARFAAEVEHALTRARRAARDARAQSADVRRRTEELSAQAKTGKLRGLRRSEVAPTDQAARGEAVKFRADNGLPVPDLPTAAELMPRRDPRPRTPENEDFSQHQVLFDVDKEPLAPRPAAPAPEPVEKPETTRMSEVEDEFSHQRILMDATDGTYRPDENLRSAFDLDDPDTRR
jgi:hypothetical protein